MSRITVKLNHAGVKALLGSQEVRDELTKHAERVAAAAGDGVEVQQVTTGGYRAVSQAADTRPGAISRQAATGALLRALDSA